MSTGAAIPKATQGAAALKDRLQKRRVTSNYIPVPANAASLPNMSLVDEPFWNQLPDILQVQPAHTLRIAFLPLMSCTTSIQEMSHHIHFHGHSIAR